MAEKATKPKPRVFRLIDQHVKKNCLLAIESAPEGAGVIVTIATEKETRSKAQHRLKWVWMGQIEREMAGIGYGRDKDQWNNFFKVRLMPNLLIAQDESLHDLVDTMRGTWQVLKEAGRDKLFIEMMIGNCLATEDLSVQSMSEFMSGVDQIALNDFGIMLVTPNELGWSIAR